MLYQLADTALNPKQPIYEIIGRPLAFYQGIKGEENKRRVRELLTLIDLDPDIYYSRLPGELSGGQKQRVSIARALAAEAELIICDEVTSALDQVVAEGILKLLDRLQQKYNLSYLFITHDLATVRAIADQVIVMYQGEVVDQAPTETLFKPPYHPYTEKLLSSVPQMDPHWLDNLLKTRANTENESVNEHS
jgi:peptide/nickel transport system ATP-binding protein